MRAAILFLLFVLGANPVAAQGIGNNFPTPNGSIAPGVAILVPTGPITNGQPNVAPPGPNNGISVTCTNCSPSAPTGASSNPVNGTIAVNGVFQSLMLQNSQRKGCTFQNQSSHVMYFSIASVPSLANSLQVPAGAFFNCSSANIVITDAVQITGTATDAFAGQWQ